MKTIFGIDFGTTNSVLAINKNGNCGVADIDGYASNKKTLRSVIYANEDHRFFMGQEGINEYVKDGAIGKFMQSIKSFLPSEAFARIFVNEESYEIEDLIAMIIKKIKDQGERLVEENVEDVVIGRPSVFSDDPRRDKMAEERLVLSFMKAGFKNVYVQYEPIAAALGYEASLKDGEEKIMLVGDFGGGTSDFTVVKLRGGDYAKGKHDRKNDILSVGGVYIGGDTFDSRIMWEKVAKYFGKDIQYSAMSGGSLGFPAWIVYRFCQWHLISQLNEKKTREFLKQLKRVADNPQAVINLENLIDDNYGFMLFQAIEKAKCDLSDSQLATINFKERDLVIKEDVSRLEFEQIIGEEEQKIRQCIDETIKNSGLDVKDIDLVLLTGGSSKIPSIKKIFTDKFGDDKLVHADEFSSVAYGLAVHGSQFI